MQLTSSVFDPDQLIPSKYTCDGENISPPLNWDEPPKATRSFTLICDDPDAPGKTWVHWIVYNLPSSIRSLPENAASTATPLSDSLQGRNDFKQMKYGGPCPPSGTHRYFFKLYALDTNLKLESGATKAQVEATMSEHILAQAQLIGLYKRRN
ncbi:MAG: YbhB/YbcL family Raf kinase inhibitor-like protein [Xenococcaceae cyanobacterium MO_188.B19]|nr:YbhB/YbcL family Raf kinase inhibitor-like protein [Xenococcaceae cyanobacterium MO_188.B19]